MRVKVKYFAILREATNLGEEIIECSCKTPGELFSFLKNKYHFPVDITQIKAAVNDEYAPWDKPLENSDTVVFIPPVSGG